MNNTSADKTQRLMLTGSTLSPSKEVIQKVALLSRELGNRRIVLVLDPKLGADTAFNMLSAAQEAYAKEGASIQRLAKLEEISALSKEEAPPIVILGGGDHVSLIPALQNNSDVSQGLRRVAQKSLLIAACAGAVAVSQGNRAMLVSNNKLDAHKLEGLGLTNLDVLPKHLSGAEGKEERIDKITQSHFNANPASEHLGILGQGGIYIQGIGQNETYELYGDAQTYNNPEKQREITSGQLMANPALSRRLWPSSIKQVAAAAALAHA